MASESNHVQRTIAVPTTPKGRRTWASILAAARVVFGRDGFTHARMSDVAQEAGISMGGLYRYFENKTTLFEALIGDIHEELYEASRSRTAELTDQPFAALLEANYGYLLHYYRNRDVMRTFIEAANIDADFRKIWWDMRDRHVERFAHALAERAGSDEVDGIDIGEATAAMACLVEQCALVWFAHSPGDEPVVSVEKTAYLATRAWYRLLFTMPGEGELSAAQAADLLAAYDDAERD